MIKCILTNYNVFFFFLKHQLRLAYLQIPVSKYLSYTEYTQAVKAIYGVAVTASGSETLGPPIDKSVA